MAKNTFGVIVGNRGFFPDSLARDGRSDILGVLDSAGFGSVILSERDSKYGAVETFAEAKACAALFAEHSDKIDGIIVSLPNFGDERGVAETIKRSGLRVPVLIHAEPDNSAQMTTANRRDSFCGKISVCNNLRQADIPYTLTRRHTVSVNSDDFRSELDEFAAVCRVVKGLKNARFGAIGARPSAFNTVRYSEKILEQAGIAVETIDLSEIIGRALKLSDKDDSVAAKLNSVKDYVPTSRVPADSLLRIAKFGVVVDAWVSDMELNGSAIQCWTSLEEHYGITPCTVMSMMSESLLPSACEVDVTGLLGMYILQLAGGTPSALLDWNNNYCDDPDKCVLFHCSNLPRSFFDSAVMDYQEIIGGSVGKENTCGTVVGRIKPGAATFCRTSTDDICGELVCYVGQGNFTDDSLETFGGYGVMEIPNLPSLMEYICRNGFEHHVAVNFCSRAEAIAEAVDTYLGWDIYRHE